MARTKNSNARRGRRSPATHNQAARRAKPGRSQQSSQGIGATIGGFLGGAAETGIRMLLGAGEYEEAIQSKLPEDEHVGLSSKPGANSLVKPLTSRQVPLMHNDTEGRVRVTRREFVGNITADPAVPLQFRINLAPGDVPGGSAVMAPWLSGIAKHWQKYSFLGLAFEYIPTSSIYSSGGPALGSVSMGVAYDSDASTGTFTKLDVLNLDNATSASPASSQLIPIECAGDETVIPVKYVFDSGYSPVTALGRWYNLGLLIIHIEGTSAQFPFICGELWVTYDVMLLGTKLPVSVGAKPPALFLPKRFQTVYTAALGPENLGFRCIGMKAVDWVENICAIASANAELASPEAVIAWTRASFAATMHNEGLTHRPLADAPPPIFEDDSAASADGVVVRRFT